MSSSSSSNLRPYYNPETFNSPVKSHQGLTVVHGGSSLTSGSSDTFISTASQRRGADRSSSSSSGAGSNFVYLDIDVAAGEGIGAVGMSILQLYSRVLVSQPFEVARVLLQIGQWPDDYSKKPSSDGPTDIRGAYADDGLSSDDEVDYFTPTIDETGSGDNSSASAVARRAARRRQSPKSTLPSSSPAASSGPSGDPVYVNAITPLTIHISDILASLNAADGFKGLWRGLHTTFVLEAASSVIESWVSGFLSSVAAIPDPHFVPILHSPSPLASLTTAVLATVATTVILSPFDVIRTKFLATTFATQPRSFRACVSRITSYTTPSLVLIPTVLHSGFSSLISLSTPYVLYTRLGIDRLSSPSLYNLCLLISSLLNIAIKMPLETMIHRAHIVYLDLARSSLIVHPAQYSGVMSTLWDIVTGKESLATLYRGWRVCVTAAVAEWGVTAIQHGGEKTREYF